SSTSDRGGACVRSLGATIGLLARTCSRSITCAPKSGGSERLGDHRGGRLRRAVAPEDPEEPLTCVGHASPVRNVDVTPGRSRSDSTGSGRLLDLREVRSLGLFSTRGARRSWEG